MEGLLLAAAAIVVTHNSALVIDQCLNAIRRHAPHVKVIVVDNASTDDTLERIGTHTEVSLLANPVNLGFAAALNQGARLAAHVDFLLILNPDAELMNPLNMLTEACRVHGLAAGQLTNGSEQPQAGFTIRRFPSASTLIFELFGLNRLWRSNPVNRRYRYLDRDLSQAGLVEQPAGAFLMTRRDVWQRLGGMDESFYPVWFEDVDFCRRAVDSGYQIEYVPSVKACHQGGHSVGRLPTGCRTLYWCDSLLRYAAKHFRTIQFRGVCLAVLLSSVPRGFAGIIRERNLELLTVSMRVAAMAIRRLVSSQTTGHGD